VPLYLHTYVWPFAIIWPIFLRYYLSEDLYNKHIGGEEWTFVWCGAIITVQSLVWLSTNWNVNLKSLFTTTKAKAVEDANLIKVLPITNAGSADICKIIRDDVSNNGSNKLRILTDPGWWKEEHIISIPETQIHLQ
jgi:cation-transporting ATPase 13A1